MLAKHLEHKCKVSPNNALLSTYMKCHVNIIFVVQWNKIFKQLCLNVITSKMLNHAFLIVRNKCYILDTWLIMQEYICLIYLCCKFLIKATPFDLQLYFDIQIHLDNVHNDFYESNKCSSLHRTVRYLPYFNFLETRFAF